MDKLVYFLILLSSLLLCDSGAAFITSPSSLISLPSDQRRLVLGKKDPTTIIHRWASTNTNTPETELSRAQTTTAATTTTTTNNNKKQRQEDYARGAALLMENVDISRGTAQILNNIHWRVEPKTKWALIGGNGCGKSTLLKAIVGEILHDNGDIYLGGGIVSEVGYLRQTAVSGSNRTIFEEAASGMKDLQDAKLGLERVQQKIAEAAASSSDNANNNAITKTSTTDDNDEKQRRLLQELDRATSRYEAVGGYTQEQKVATVLKGLGFNDLEKRCDELSGGWQMRVAFAKLLLSEPKLCLMDEPGNHLDAAARKWLANYLATYDGDGTMVLVTHDVQLLESMDHIAEVTPTGNLQVYKSCTYSQYLELKQQRAKASQTEYERNQKKAAKLQGFVDRFGASATKASAAQSRVKQLEKMEREGLLQEPDEAIVMERFRPTLILPQPPRTIGDTILALKNAAVGYDDKQPPLVKNVNLELTRGMKLLIRGPNGAGKSTLLHSLRGTLPLIDGERIENQALRLGVFTQDLAQELDGEARAVDIVTAYARDDYEITISDEQARSVLGRLGLRGEKSLRKLENLSGGEKARVALACFAIKPSNCILLDEVSNHMDRECVEALSEALTNWGVDDAAVVVISHDRAFCEKVGFTHVGTVADGKFTMEQRSMNEKDWQVVRTTLDATTNLEEETNNNSPTTKEADDVDPLLRKKLFNAPKRISKLESLIEKAEAEIVSLDEEMLANGNDVGLLVDLSRKKENLEGQVLEYMEEWEDLEALMSQHQ